MVSPLSSLTRFGWPSTPSHRSNSPAQLPTREDGHTTQKCFSVAAIHDGDYARVVSAERALSKGSGKRFHPGVRKEPAKALVMRVTFRLRGKPFLRDRTWCR